MTTQALYYVTASLTTTGSRRVISEKLTKPKAKALIKEAQEQNKVALTKYCFLKNFRIKTVKE